MIHIIKMNINIDDLGTLIPPWRWGTADHPRPMYKHAYELGESDMGRNGSQYVLSQIFWAQEYLHELYHVELTDERVTMDSFEI